MEILHRAFSLASHKTIRGVQWTRKIQNVFVVSNHLISRTHHFAPFPTQNAQNLWVLKTGLIAFQACTLADKKAKLELPPRAQEKRWGGSGDRGWFVSCIMPKPQPTRTTHAVADRLQAHPPQPPPREANATKHNLHLSASRAGCKLYKSWRSRWQSDRCHSHHLTFGSLSSQWFKNMGIFTVKPKLWHHHGAFMSFYLVPNSSAKINPWNSRGEKSLAKVMWSKNSWQNPVTRSLILGCVLRMLREWGFMTKIRAHCLQRTFNITYYNIIIKNK